MGGGREKRNLIMAMNSIRKKDRREGDCNYGGWEGRGGGGWYIGDFLWAHSLSVELLEYKGLTLKRNNTRV